MITITHKIEHIPILHELIRDEFDKLFYNKRPPHEYRHRVFVLTGRQGIDTINRSIRDTYGNAALVFLPIAHGLYHTYELPIIGLMQVAWQPHFDYAYEGKPKHPKSGFPLSSFQCDVYVEAEPAFRIQFVA